MSGDRNRNEVSVRTAITDSGLSISARSRAVSAFDRLLGGFFGIPAAWLEQVEASIRNRTDRESIIQEAAADRLSTAILNDQENLGVVADMALALRLGPILNKMRIAELAVEELSSSEANDETPAHEQDEDDVDQDWLNHFASYAERVSSEGVQQFWAKVLAGEIRQRRSFSLSSLRLLSELDQHIAATFQNVVQHRSNNEFIVKPEIEELAGERLYSLAFLEEVGLLQSIDAIGGVVNRINPNDDGVAIVRERNLVLVMEVQATVELPIIPLTRSGREIASILPPANPLEVLDRVGAAIMEKVTSAEIRRILSKTQAGLVTAPLKTLKTKQ